MVISHTAAPLHDIFHRCQKVSVLHSHAPSRAQLSVHGVRGIRLGSGGGLVGVLLCGGNVHLKQRVFLIKLPCG